MMSFFRPTPTLLVGIALGMFVIPKLARKANINLPG